MRQSREGVVVDLDVVVVVVVVVVAVVAVVAVVFHKGRSICLVASPDRTRKF